MNYDTTRKHPRTLAEAFPDSRASCTEGWQKPAYRAVTWTLVIGIVAIIFAIAFQGAPV